MTARRLASRPARAVVAGLGGRRLRLRGAGLHLQGEDSSTWHPAVGAGLFSAPFKRTSVVGVRIGRNDEWWFLSIETRIARLGF